MKNVFGIILSSIALLAGCGTNTISKNALKVNEYTQSDIGTYIEKIGCELYIHNREGEKAEITVNKCSTISNHDAVTYIKENLVNTKDNIKPLIYFKRGR